MAQRRRGKLEISMNSLVSTILAAVRLLSVQPTLVEQRSETHLQMQGLSTDELRCVSGGAPKGSWLDD